MTIDAAVAFAFESDRMVFVEIVSGADTDVFAIPMTEEKELAPVAFAAVERFRTVLPVIVLTPLVVAMPPITRKLVATEGRYALFRLATVLLVIEIVAELLLLIPVTTCA